MGMGRRIMAYWLFKSEPAEYGIHHLEAESQKTTCWHGIRNYQARNLLRDNIHPKDLVLFYHSSCKPTAVVGVTEVITSAYPDPTQFDEHSPYYDVKSTKDDPRWFCVDIKLHSKFAHPVELTCIKHNPKLKNMVLLKQGRLSIQPVQEEEFNEIKKMARLVSAR